MVTGARESRLIVGQWVMWVVDWVGTQCLADALPEVQRYCTDGGAIYPVVVWPGDGTHVLSVNKGETSTYAYVFGTAEATRPVLQPQRGEAGSGDTALRVALHKRRRRVINANPAYVDALPLLF